MCHGGMSSNGFSAAHAGKGYGNINEEGERLLESCICELDLAPVVRKVNSTIHWITQLVLLVFIHWIVMYPVDNSVIYLLKNRGLVVTNTFFTKKEEQLITYKSGIHSSQKTT